MGRSRQLFRRIVPTEPALRLAIPGAAPRSVVCTIGRLWEQLSDRRRILNLYEQGHRPLRGRPPADREPDQGTSRVRQWRACPPADSVLRPPAMQSGCCRLWQAPHDRRPERLARKHRASSHFNRKWSSKGE